MRLAVAATPSVALASLEALLASHHTLIRIFTQPDRPAGRGRKVQSSPIANWAREHQIELQQPHSSHEISEHLADVDCVITIGFGVLLPEEILDIPKYGFLNLHFSLLPRWRGAAPVQRAIEAGDETTGVTVFRLDKGMDTGPVYLQESIALKPEWHTGEAMAVLSSLGAQSLIQALAKIEAGVAPIPQDEEGATRARKLSHEEARIDWNASAEEIVRKVRAFTPHPGAWTELRGSVLKIEEVAIINEEIHPMPGMIHLHHREVYVGTSTNAIALTVVRPAGRNSMLVHDWVNGARLKDGELLG